MFGVISSSFGSHSSWDAVILDINVDGNKQTKKKSENKAKRVPEGLQTYL